MYWWISVDEEQGDFITLILFKTCVVGNKLLMHTYVGEHEGNTYALKYLSHSVDSNGSTEAQRCSII
jgi:hypothetical protein